MKWKIKPNRNRKIYHLFYAKSGMYIVVVIILFVAIGLLTTIKPAYRISSNTITNWTSKIDSSIFLYLLGLENRSFRHAFPEDESPPGLSKTLFQMATSMRPDDPRSLLGQEIPGFALFGNRIIVAGKGTDYTNLPIESSPPLEDVLREREAVIEETDEDDQTKQSIPDTAEKKVVFIYNTHNRESFLPHLPDIDDPDLAHHDEVNVTKISERLAESLEVNGIGAIVDETDIMDVLNEKDWEYGQSYEASRQVVEEAFSTNEHLNFVFDIHRDGMSRKHTTMEMEGETYAKIMFVVGEEHDTYENNLALATQLNDLIEETYPGLSRGVITKGGSGNNGIYNQDVSENALTIEIGGVGNDMEELYRSADILAEIFSEFYWDAEEVNVNVGEDE